MILVVGATGTTGREVIRLLSAASIQTRAFVRNPAKTILPEFYNIEIATGDLDDVQSIKEALKGIDKIYLATPNDPRQVEWEGNVVQAALECNVQYIVKLSTLGADINSPLSMSRWHGEAEGMVESSGIPHTFLRSHNFMQNTLSFAPGIVSENIIRAPVKKGRVSMVDARDIAAATMALLTDKKQPEKIYRITGSEALSYQDIADKISMGLGKTIRFENISYDAAKQTMLGAGTPDWLADDLILLYRRFEEGQGARITDDFIHLTGRAPIRFDQFVRDYADIFRGKANIP